MTIKKLTSLLATIALLSAAFISTAAQAKTTIFDGSEIFIGTTPGQVSEFQNKVKTHEDRLSARLNLSDYFHASYRKDQISAKVNGINDPRIRFLQKDFDWVGVGLHSKQTYLTYYRDSKTNDYFLLALAGKLPVTDKVSVIYGLSYMNKDKGNWKGKESTSLQLGARYNFNRHFALQGAYEVSDKFAKFVDDRVIVGVVLTK